MTNKLRSTVEGLFEEAPHTKKAFELKEELIGNLTEKYNDLVSRGRTPEEAYNSVIASIGEIDELIKGLKQKDSFDHEKYEIARKRTALVVSGSVGLYILSFIILILTAAVFVMDGVIAFILFLIVAAIPTCLLIYHFMTQPRYAKLDDTLVEEFKEWKQTNIRKKELYNSVTSIVWTLIVIIYLIISFAFGIWAYSWIIFIIGAVIQQIIKLVFDMTYMKR